MNVRSLKLAGAAAGVFFLVGAAPNVYAQTPIDVFGQPRFGAVAFVSNVASPKTTTYTFNKSMILNSIGFYTNDEPYTSLAYSINGVDQSFSTGALRSESGTLWLDLLSPLTMQENGVVSITTLGQLSGNGYYFTTVTDYAEFNNDANVSIVAGELGSDFNGTTFVGYTNGNLRVSNPSSNVAPEPGSIALLLTGGGALAGIALRRRRNAA
jgi:hypothetical protein